ncbi:hypothetical protein WME75_20140 [Sorangium sp. So ce1014]|uniref:hypothetical protein n=1 Tax=Sorangium sp. So ce1014 TaxID=3133326 RepID=UPI003F60B602
MPTRAELIDKLARELRGIDQRSSHLARPEHHDRCREGLATFVANPRHCRVSQHIGRMRMDKGVNHGQERGNLGRRLSARGKASGIFALGLSLGRLLLPRWMLNRVARGANGPRKVLCSIRTEALGERALKVDPHAAPELIRARRETAGAARFSQLAIHFDERVGFVQPEHGIDFRRLAAEQRNERIGEITTALNSQATNKRLREEHRACPRPCGLSLHTPHDERLKAIVTVKRDPLRQGTDQGARIMSGRELASQPRDRRALG